MNLTRVALFFCGGLFVVLGPLHLPGDGDLYWQRWLGEMILRTHQIPGALGTETFTAPGATWVPQEWLFSVAVAFSHDHRFFTLFTILVSLLPLGILLSIVARAKGDVSSQAIGIALIFAGIAMAESFGVRAQVVGWFCFAWTLYFLERRDGWRYAAVAMTVIWANLHASVTIVPAIILVRLLALAVDRRWRETGREALMLVCVTIAVCCTPFGLRLPEYALALSHSPIRHYIQEWQPSGFGDGSLLYGALPLALAIVLGGRATLLNRKPQLFVAAMLFVAMLFAGRNIPIFAIAAAPLAAAGIAARFPAIATLWAGRRDLEYVAVPAIAAALIWSGISLVHQQSSEPPSLPLLTIAELGRDGSTHRVFCENFTWCSVALQYPALHVFIDGRCDPYPVAVWQRYIDVVKRKPASRRILDDYGVDAVVAKRDSGLARDLEAPPWHVAGGDAAYVLLRRD